MLRPRIIPVLLLRGDGLIKGIKFNHYQYVGDPINAVKIFSEKKADEILFLDIDASREHRIISTELVRKVAEESYMPFGVGGGIKTIEDIRKLLGAGAEKVSINTALVESPNLVSEAANKFGSQSIVASIDVKRKWNGAYQIIILSGKKATGLDPIAFAAKMEKLGAGEIMINSIERDGTMQGYDLNIISQIAKSVNIPVIACGGARNIADLRDAIHIGEASAAAAGSLFVFHGPKRAVLISYPSYEDLEWIYQKSGL